MNRRALDHLNAMPERYRFIRGMVSWIGLKQVAFAYERDQRFAGTTHYPLKKMVLLAMDAMTSFSIVPLRFASHLGMIFGFLGLAALGYTLFSWIAGSVLPGWTSLAAIVLILGSVQLLVLGIFGEYLGRMYMETKRRPLYLINEIAAHDPAAGNCRPSPSGYGRGTDEGSRACFRPNLTSLPLQYQQQHAASIRLSGETPDFFAKYKIDDVAARLARPIIKPRRILDFGAGVGNSLGPMRAAFPDSEIILLDPSSQSLDIARKRFPGQADFRHFDGRNDPL